MSPLHSSRPVEILLVEDNPGDVRLTTRYRDALDAHNALAVAATKGTDQNQYAVVPGVVGVAYRVAFDPQDAGRDWAFGFSKASVLVVVRTARSDSSFTALQLAQAIYPRS